MKLKQPVPWSILTLNIKINKTYIELINGSSLIKIGTVKMDSEWEILHAITFPNEANSKNTIIGRITRPKVGSAIMFDLRVFTQDRPTKMGMALHLPELKWVSKTLFDAKEGSLERPHRNISLSKIWFGTRFTVYKKKINLNNEITLDKNETNFLMNNLNEIITFMEQQAISLKIPVEFVAGERIMEKYPKN